MRRRIVLSALLLVVCISPIFLTDSVTAFELDPGPIGVPSGDFTAVKNYIYFDGNNKDFQCGSTIPEVAFAEMRLDDYCLTVSVGLCSVLETNPARDTWLATLCVSVCYTYVGSRIWNKGAISNVKLEATKVADSDNVEDFALSFTNDLQDHQAWYPHGFKDNGDLDGIADSLYGGVQKAVGLASGFIPGGKIAAMPINAFISWVRYKMTNGECLPAESEWYGTKAAIDMRNTHYPFTYDLDNDDSTASTKAYDFVGSFMFEIEYDASRISNGDVIGVDFDFIMDVGKLESNSMAYTRAIYAPTVSFDIKM